MRTEKLVDLFREEIRDVRSVEQQLVEVLDGIANGVSVEGLSPAIRRILETSQHRVIRLDRIAHEMGCAHASPPSHRAPLSSRQVEVLQLIAEGYANKQIAAELAISVKTVEKHRQRVMAKLELRGAAGLTRYAISAGIVAAVA